MLNFFTFNFDGKVLSVGLWQPCNLANPRIVNAMDAFRPFGLISRARSVTSKSNPLKFLESRVTK